MRTYETFKLFFDDSCNTEFIAKQIMNFNHTIGVKAFKSIIMQMTFLHPKRVTKALQPVDPIPLFTMNTHEVFRSKCNVHKKKSCIFY